jgi:hypothetical protein
MTTGLRDLERERLLLMIGRDMGDQDLSLRTMEIWGLCSTLPLVLLALSGHAEWDAPTITGLCGVGWYVPSTIMGLVDLERALSIDLLCLVGDEWRGLPATIIRRGDLDRALSTDVLRLDDARRELAGMMISSGDLDRALPIDLLRLIGDTWREPPTTIICRGDLDRALSIDLLCLVGDEWRELPTTIILCGDA